MQTTDYLFYGSIASIVLALGVWVVWMYNWENLRTRYHALLITLMGVFALGAVVMWYLRRRMESMQKFEPATHDSSFMDTLDAGANCLCVPGHEGKTCITGQGKAGGVSCFYA